MKQLLYILISLIAFDSNASDIIKSLSPEEEQELAQAAQAIEQHVNSLSPEEQAEFYGANRIMSIAIEKTNNEIKYIQIKILGEKEGIKGVYISGDNRSKVEIVELATYGFTDLIQLIPPIKDSNFFKQAKATIQTIPDNEFKNYFTLEPEIKYVERTIYDFIKEYHPFTKYKKVHTERLLWQTATMHVIPGTWQEALYSLAKNTWDKALTDQLPRWTWVDTLKSYFGR